MISQMISLRFRPTNVHEMTSLDVLLRLSRDRIGVDRIFENRSFQQYEVPNWLHKAESV